MKFAPQINEDESFWAAKPPEEIGRIMVGYRSILSNRLAAL